jgi:hypothetical protein
MKHRASKNLNDNVDISRVLESITQNIKPSVKVNLGATKAFD